MAKNYSLAEAVQVIVENEDAAQIMELGKRFPLLVSKVTFIAAKAGTEFNDLMQFMPDNLSANKVNQSIKRALETDDVEDGDDFDEEEETPKKQVKSSNKSAKSEDTDGDDYENWNNAKMYKLLGELGKRKDCKEKFGDLSHDSMLKYLKKYGPVDGTATEVEDDTDVEGEDDVIDYSTMKATELYKLCKSRKINAEQKKPAKYYITLLKKADEEAKQVEDDVDDGWEEEEVEEEPVKKPAKKAATTKAKKPAKKAAKTKVEAEDDDEDEDWDI